MTKMKFNLYFAGSDDGTKEHIPKIGANRLYSYHNDKKSIIDFCNYSSRGPLMVDSGAFSVAHSGAIVDIDEYIKWINNNKHIENFIELDLIPYPILNQETARESAETSWKNYLYMIERLDEPFKLLPVFHFGESVEYLKQMLEFEYKSKKIPFICIGGRHGVSTEKQEKYFENLFKIIHQSYNPNVKIHVLGMTVFSTLEKFPFYSADSTSHLQIAIYGGIMSEFGTINISSKNTKKNNFTYFSQDEQQIITNKVESLGYSIEQLKESREARIQYNIDYCFEWSKNYQYKGPKSFIETGLF